MRKYRSTTNRLLLLQMNYNLRLSRINEEIPEHHEQVALASDELQPPVQDRRDYRMASEDTIELAEMITTPGCSG